jgi:hypothetical protein
VTRLAPNVGIALRFNGSMGPIDERDDVVYRRPTRFGHGVGVRREVSCVLAARVLADLKINDAGRAAMVLGLLTLPDKSGTY